MHSCRELISREGWAPPPPPRADAAPPNDDPPPFLMLLCRKRCSQKLVRAPSAT